MCLSAVTGLRTCETALEPVARYYPRQIAPQPIYTANALAASLAACRQILRGGEGMPGKNGFAATISAAAIAVLCVTPCAAETQVERGKYLASLGGCMDCHTPGYFFGKPDMARYLAGSEVGFEIPGVGVFHGPNLTPDKETGLGSWTDEQIVTAIQKGLRPDGRMLAPIMPWRALANLTKDDAQAIVAYLRSIPAVENKVPGPFGPSEKATSFVMKIVPPDK
jgi:mono/diheme cytochrome c family protein